MNAPQFTSGPWGYEHDNGDWNILYDLTLEHGPRRLGKVFDHAGEFQEADARLIAKAPEMFEALEDIEQIIRRDDLLMTDPELSAFVSSVGSLLRPIRGAP